MPEGVIAHPIAVLNAIFSTVGTTPTPCCMSTCCYGMVRHDYRYRVSTAMSSLAQVEGSDVYYVRPDGKNSCLRPTNGGTACIEFVGAFTDGNL